MIKQYIREIINPLLIVFWRLNGIKVDEGKTFYSQEEKRAFIREVCLKRPDIRTFIETGTHLGNTIEFLKNDFDKIFSIELSEEYAKNAVIRFEKEPHIKIIQGDSSIELPKLLENIQGPCAFWLDGHYSYGDTALAQKETPILDEVGAILRSKEAHIILIDDARLFIGRHHYPLLSKFAQFIKKADSVYSISMSKDIILLSKN